MEKQKEQIIVKSDKIHKVQRVSSKEEKKGGIFSNERGRTIVSLKLRLSGDILKARKSFGWTQQEAAGMVGISLREYQNIEGGKCIPTTEVFLRKWLYPEVAKRYETNWKAMERSIRTASGIIWKQNRALLEELAGRQLEVQPRAAQLLAILAAGVKRERPQAERSRPGKEEGKEAVKQDCVR